MVANIPLTLSSAFVNSYTPIISTNVSNLHFTDEGNLYKTVVHPSPVQTFISPLGTAIHNNDPIVYHHKYHEFSAPDKSDKNITLSVSSPTIISSPIMPINSDSVQADPEVKSKMTAYFFEKTMNDWLHSDFKKLLKYLIVKGDNISIIKNEKDFSNNEAFKNVDKKIDFIANNVMTKYDMKSFLKKLVLKKDISWFYLRDYKRYVKKAIYKKIKKNIQKMTGKY